MLDDWIGLQIIRKKYGGSTVLRPPGAAHARQKATRNHLQIGADLSPGLEHVSTTAMRTNECVAVLTSDWHWDEGAM